MPKKKYSWPSGYPEKLSGKTLTLPLCIDIEKHSSDDLEALVELVNDAADKNIPFKVKFSIADTLFRHNVRFYLALQAITKLTAEQLANIKSPQEVTEIINAAVTPEEINRITNEFIGIWNAQNSDILKSVKDQIRDNDYIQKWDYWIKGKNEVKFTEYFQQIARAPLTDITLNTLLENNRSTRFNHSRGKIKLSENISDLVKGFINKVLYKILSDSISDYLIEENAVFRLWGEAGLNYILYDGPLPSSMVHVNTKYLLSKKIDVIRPIIELPSKVNDELRQNKAASPSVSIPPVHSVLPFITFSPPRDMKLSASTTVASPAAGDLHVDEGRMMDQTGEKERRFVKSNTYPPDPHLVSAVVAVGIEKVIIANRMVENNEVNPNYPKEVADATALLLSRIGGQATSISVVVPGIFVQPSPRSGGSPSQLRSPISLEASASSSVSSSVSSSTSVSQRSSLFATLTDPASSAVPPTTGVDTASSALSPAVTPAPGAAK